MTRPARQRPGSTSPILEVQVEPVRTPGPLLGSQDDNANQDAPIRQPSSREVAPASPDATATPDKPLQVPAVATVQAPPHQQDESPTTADRPRTVADYLRGPKATTSTSLGIELKARAETAVLRTAPLPGGARSFAALLNEALARELIRLSEEFNDGVPFEPNNGAFRTGRPFGS